LEREKRRLMGLGSQRVKEVDDLKRAFTEAAAAASAQHERDLAEAINNFCIFRFLAITNEFPSFFAHKLRFISTLIRRSVMRRLYCDLFGNFPIEMSHMKL
jgi:hypothetical protein